MVPGNCTLLLGIGKSLKLSVSVSFQRVLGNQYHGTDLVTGSGLVPSRYPCRGQMDVPIQTQANMDEKEDGKINGVA